MGAIIFIALTVLFAGPLAAQDDPRPTVQSRFALKKKTIFAHAVATTHIRNDFYTMFGVGLDAGYYFGEKFGLEARAFFIDSSLSPAAKDLKEKTGLTPDARPQTAILLAGVRASLGYGKILIWNSVLHFDPQLFVHGGTAFAERRVLPTALYGVALLTHFRWGLQVKIDLAGSFQMEKRATGWKPSFGFMPILGVGWNWHLAKEGS